ncbi:chemotaxis protein CheX [Lentibacillus sediminis]|uniref:chemotaxis protein CheX n=1 Tax=Lentibacillus sediminis TaxID=1940529 RepID=UPI000C1C582D|nr:chemotaxis protein CheX [Lentibacillus sediminis]
MSLSTRETSKHITILLNGTLTSLKSVIPIGHEIERPRLLQTPLKLEYGVLIGITGDVKGKLILSGKPSTFGTIGTSMFGMELEGDMLESFSGELGNMIAGKLATSIYEEQVEIDITYPTVLQGKTMVSGYNKAILVSAWFADCGEMEIYVLLD